MKRQHAEVRKRQNQKSHPGHQARFQSLVSSLLSLLPLLPLAFFALFYFYPMGALVWRSLGPEMLSTLAQPNTWRVAGFTFGQAALSTLLTVLVGLPGAYLVGRYHFRGKELLRALTAVPFVMPPLVAGAGFKALIGDNGWINALLAALSLPPLSLSNSLAAILLAHIFYNTTVVIRVVGDYWSHLDPRLAQAAQTLGASPLRAFAAVTLPLLAPALLAASLLVFIFNFTSFGVILVLGGPRFATLEVEIYRQTFAFFNLPGAAALAALQLAITFGLTLAYTRLSAAVSAVSSIRSAAFTQRPLRTRRQRLAAGLVVAMLFILLLSPLAALAARSVVRLGADRGQRADVAPALTLHYYAALFQNERGQAFFATPIESLGNSAQYAVTTVILSLALGLPTAWVLSVNPSAGTEQRSTPTARGNGSVTHRYFETLLLLPLGTSAVSLGLGFLLAFSRPPFHLRASPLLIPLAHTLIAFPFVVRALLPTWRSIRPSWRAAAATLGATPAETARRIDLPLVGRAALVAAAFAFAISIGEFGATALLNRPEFPTAASVIYAFIGQPGALNYGRALAMSTLLMVTAAASILLIERVRIKGMAEF